MQNMSEAGRLRRAGVACAAMVAVLAIVPALMMEHGHRWVGFAGIGLQVVLLVIALTLLAKAKKVAADQREP